VFPESDGRATLLGPGVTLFGRDPECAGCLPSDQISRNHAEVRWAGGVPMLRDAGSTNGVFLNQRRVTQAPLRPRDVVRLGDWVGVVAVLPRQETATWTFEEVTEGYWAGPVLLERLAAARRVAASDLPIVIQGATGAGKEGAARAIHLWSGRPGPFLGLNCAALPEALAEAELFGYRKGAFTGADRANPGYMRAANNGTLFLDEIADLPLPVQVKLLRAIELREVVPLGETTPAPVDVRFLAATQSPLRAAVEEKRFRGDLYARLDGFTMEIPSLRERAEEVPFLFRKLLEKHGTATVAMGLDPLLVERLCLYDWPFNVRELALLARRLLVLHPGAGILDNAMWSDPPRLESARAPASARSATLPDKNNGEEQEELNPDVFLEALRANGGNVKQTAGALGISRGRAYRLMRQIDSLNIDELRRETTGRSLSEK